MTSDASRKTERPAVMLAPMAGITDAAMRVVSGEMGASLCFTEMVSAEGLVHDSLRTSQLLEKLPGETQPVAHIYGGNPDSMAEAARIITERGGYAGIDINAGCPVRKVMKCGGGAALMQNPTLVGRIVSAIVAHTDLPVTLKTRIGLHPGAVTVFDIVKAVEDSGGAGVTVHGRFASLMHSGLVDLELLRQTVESAGIPVVVNGGVKSAADALALLSATGAAGVMIGRGALGNPWLFSEIRAALGGAEPAAPRSQSDSEIVAMLKRHFTLSLDLKTLLKSKYPPELCTCKDPELSAVHDFRHYMFNYFKGRPGSLVLRRRMDEYETIPDVMRAIEEHVLNFSPPSFSETRDVAANTGEVETHGIDQDAVKDC